MDGAPVAWSLYFPDEAFCKDDRRVLLIELLLRFLVSEHGWAFLSQLRHVLNTLLVLPLDFVKLCEASKIADLEPALALQPNEALGCLGASVYEVLFEVDLYKSKLKELLGLLPAASRVTVRLHNVPQSQICFREIQSGLIGKLVTLKGTVIRQLPSRPVVTQIDYVCGKCGTSMTVVCPDGRVQQPSKCDSGGCRSKSFQAVVSSMATRDWQKIRIQELLTVSRQDSQRAGARTAEVELNDDCVSSCTCGDTVSVVGFVRVMSADNAGGRGKQSSGLSLIYVEAVSLVNHSSTTPSLQQSASVAAQTSSHAQAADAGASALADFSLKDLHFVVTFMKTCAPNQLAQLAHSLCPSILGHEMVKAGLILSLAGGLRKHEGDTSRVATRGDIHVLLVGDPGLGKSQLLRAASAAAPRGLYVCSNTSTAAGLTVSVVRDAVTNDFAFEAGALVLADKGVCCLDEFDKMQSEHRALLEAMEQQEVSVAKAGLTASLQARTTVIAAANPIGGTYSKAKTMHENLKMSTALLSRFDLTFVMLDEADEVKDQYLSKHVMTMHSGKSEEECRNLSRLMYASRAQAAPALTWSEDSASPVRRTLVDQLTRSEMASPLPLQLVRKFLTYAKQFCNPVLSDEAKLVLKEFYLGLRKQAAASPALNVNARQLESAVRLAEARARVDLREVVTKEDAQDVVELMQYSMRDFFVSKQELLLCKAASKASNKSIRGEETRFLMALRELAEIESKRQFSVPEIRDVAGRLGISVTRTTDLVDRLNEAGELLKKGSDCYAVA